MVCSRLIQTSSSLFVPIALLALCPSFISSFHFAVHFAAPSHYHHHRHHLPFSSPLPATFVTMPSSDSDEDFKPKAKKAKKSKKVQDDEDSEENEEETEGVKRNDDGEAYFELNKNKRCTVRKWKRTILVDIREVSAVVSYVYGLNDFLHIN